MIICYNYLLSLELRVDLAISFILRWKNFQMEFESVFSGNVGLTLLSLMEERPRQTLVQIGPESRGGRSTRRAEKRSVLM